MHKERERRESAEMKGDKLPSGRFMEGDLKELLHFSTNFHLLPPSLLLLLHLLLPLFLLVRALTGLQHAAFSKKETLASECCSHTHWPSSALPQPLKTTSRQKDGATFTPPCSSSFTSPTLDQGSIVCCCFCPPSTSSSPHIHPTLRTPPTGQ